MLVHKSAVMVRGSSLIKYIKAAGRGSHLYFNGRHGRHSPKLSIFYFSIFYFSICKVLGEPPVPPIAFFYLFLFSK